MSEVWVYVELVATASNSANSVRDELFKLESATKKESGCIQFAVCQLIDNPNKFTLWERWKDEKACKQHMSEEHTKRYFALQLTNVERSHRVTPVEKKVMADVD